MEARKLSFDGVVPPLLEEQANTYKLYCPYPNCNSRILSPGQGVLRHRDRTPIDIRAGQPPRPVPEAPGLDKERNHVEAVEHTDESMIARVPQPAAAAHEATVADPDVPGHASGASAGSLAGEQFWVLADFFDFDNIGFTKTTVVEDGRHVKFLTCADCDRGPLGYVVEDPGLTVMRSTGTQHTKEYLLDARAVLYMP
ncbi:uncharacterized protein V1510DRAFT_415413 [Dipodascopsis tothii]|uniref:uncharacterized protein n=1 Tax=Dipodascopsis tothii TaxID=44089 RepID=UPI0034CDD147